MPTIVITSQAQLDALPKAFDTPTILEIRTPPDVLITIPFHRGSSRVVAWDSSSVEAWGSSSVEAWGSSSVEARDSSSVVARGSSRVEAWDSSSVEARDSSSVEAWDSSRVVALGSSSVEARDSSSVEAWENSFCRVLNCKVLASHHQAIITLQDFDFAFPHKSSVPVIKTTTHQHDITSFCEIYPPKRKRVVLYKSVNPDTLCDFYTGRVCYKIGTTVVCPDFDPTPERQCGGGLHLSPTPGMALAYNKGELLVCEAHVDDVVIYGPDISKVRCRKVKVLREYNKEEALNG